MQSVQVTRWRCTKQPGSHQRAKEPIPASAGPARPHASHRIAQGGQWAHPTAAAYAVQAIMEAPSPHRVRLEGGTGTQTARGGGAPLKQSATGPVVSRDPTSQHGAAYMQSTPQGTVTVTSHIRKQQAARGVQDAVPGAGHAPSHRPGASSAAGRAWTRDGMATMPYASQPKHPHAAVRHPTQTARKRYVTHLGSSC